MYHITEWISTHTGGEVMLRGVGGPIDAYWDIFTIHKKQDFYDILEEYCIGTNDPQDLGNGAVPIENIDNPSKFDPNRDQRLLVLTARPCDAETPSDQLSSYITPNELLCVRNHMWVPQLDDSQHKMSLELPNGDEMEYTVADLKKFQPTKITVTLQCSGNRRNHISKEYKQASGLPWQVGGISMAEFTGVRLQDILAHAGFPVDEWPSSAAHVQFMGAEAYGGSIPIEKATDPRGDVLLGYEMIGDTLPLDHGYHVRVVVPGTIAARSVKWLNKITLSDEESTSQWQRRDYTCFGPKEGPNPDLDKACSSQEVPVQSAITSLPEHSKQRDSKLLKSMDIGKPSFLLEGYCFSGGGREIVRVDVSSDDGCTWNQAELLSDERRGSKTWAWKKWQCIVPMRAAAKSPCFVVKAVDEAYNCQPDTYAPGYNRKGNLTSAWHRVKWDG